MSLSSSEPLMNNEYVKEILSILAENGKDSKGFAALLDYVTSMENHLNNAFTELQTVQRELSGMREERNHPVRTMLQSVENNLNAASKRLNEFKEKIIDGCKDAVTMFKQKGIAALDNIAKFFKVKPALESMRDNMNQLIKADLTSVAKIETASAEYHAAGRHLKNIVRAARGKEPIQDIKPNGSLTKLITSPYHSEIKSAMTALKNIEKAIAGLDHLDRTASSKESADKAVSSTETADKAVSATEAADKAVAPKEAVNEAVAPPEAADRAAAPTIVVDKAVPLPEATDRAVLSTEATDKAKSSIDSAKKSPQLNESAEKAAPLKESAKKAISPKKSTVKAIQSTKSTGKAAPQKSTGKVAPTKKPTKKPSVAADLAKNAEEVKKAKSAAISKTHNKTQGAPEL